MSLRRCGLVRALAASGLLAGATLPLARPALAAPDADLVAALDAAGGADVVAFELPATPRAPRVRAAAAARAPVATVLSVLADPSRYAAMIPSLVRSQEVGRRGDARVIAWELEVPLFNLSGKLELRPRASGFELAMIEGDLSPGSVVFEVAASASGGAIVEIDARLDVTRTSFFLRRIMARSAFGEPAALSAAAWVALRSVVARAEHPNDAAAFRPRSPPPSPSPGRPDGGALARPALGALAARGAAAIVTLAPSGRLSGVSVGVPARDPAATVEARLADPRSWRAFPGWKRVEGVPAAPGAPARVVVEDAIPLVDMDATWALEPPPRQRWWTAIQGATRGAWFGWQVFAVAGAPTPTLAVLTMYPRLETMGSIPRRFVEAEPLLEHGMSLALVFVDAVSATRSGAR
jgi:hypothetical protein